VTRVVVKSLFLALSLLVISIGALQAQQQKPAELIFRISTDLVVLDAQVLDKKNGQPVAGLKPADFLLYEDGVKQEITHFSQDRLPLSIMLLLDVSGSVQPVIKQIQTGAEQTLQHLKTEDNVALMIFGARAELIQDFTLDRALIASQLDRISQRETTRDARPGHTYLNEGVYQAAAHMSRAADPAGRRVIIVVTDNLSNQLPGFGHSEKAATGQLFESGSVVCGLLIRSAFARVANVMQKYPSTILMRKILSMGSVGTYADKTGGEVMSAAKDEVDAKLAALIDRIRLRYSIGYISTNVKQDGRLRKIKLKLTPEAEKREGKPAVLTKQGYYAQRGGSAIQRCYATRGRGGIFDTLSDREIQPFDEAGVQFRGVLGFSQRFFQAPGGAYHRSSFDLRNTIIPMCLDDLPVQTGRPKDTADDFRIKNGSVRGDQGDTFEIRSASGVDRAELSLKLYHVRELRLGCQQSMAEARNNRQGRCQGAVKLISG